MRVGLRTLVPLALCAAALAAAAAHFLIDVVGDYALSNDSYDHLRHGSRGLLTAIALALAAMLALRGLRACCEVASRNRARVATVHFGLPETVAFFAAVLVLAALLVPAMEIFDARAAGLGFGGVGDAFGGSLFIGLSSVVCCASLAAASLYGLARWLISHRDSIATIVEVLLRRASDDPRVVSKLLHRPIDVTLRRRTPHAPLLAKRGPPEVLFV
ncbi:MAG: hypothetical protein JO263_01840 [Candidatus Eremiobacteraeota bacterium]|nr:hypothetical protein [Candidatus Eremiobacteraeota bacterium]